MQGKDKGLVHYQGRPMAAWVLQTLASQTVVLAVSANRHLPSYADLLTHAVQGAAGPGDPNSFATSGQPMQHQGSMDMVWPDDPDLPPRSGPLAGILTALRHTRTNWLLCVPCDMPHVPADLVHRLLQEAERSGADVVVPLTHHTAQEARHHWACALVHRRTMASTEQLFAAGERKVGNWVRSLNWRSVSFTDNNDFANMNTLETLHGRP
jgi:molybdopterin-guanine dinucleotide biosynthesis protein A